MSKIHDLPVVVTPQPADNYAIQRGSKALSIPHSVMPPAPVNTIIQAVDPSFVTISRLNYTFYVPANFNSICCFKIYAQGRSVATNGQVNLNSMYATGGEPFNQHTQAGSHIIPVIGINRIVVIDVSSVLTNIAALDVVGIQLAYVGFTVDPKVLLFEFF